MKAATLWGLDQVRIENDPRLVGWIIDPASQRTTFHTRPDGPPIYAKDPLLNVWEMTAATNLLGAPLVDPLGRRTTALWDGVSDDLTTITFADNTLVCIPSLAHDTLLHLAYQRLLQRLDQFSGSRPKHVCWHGQYNGGVAVEVPNESRRLRFTAAVTVDLITLLVRRGLPF